MIFKKEQLSEIIGQLHEDDVIVFPTDTVYGIGANIHSPIALNKIFEVKNRPTDKSLIILCANVMQMEEIVGPLDQQVKVLVDNFLPGGLTLILNTKLELADEITRGKSTIGLRIPNHPVALELLEKVGPLARTSANISGEPSPTMIETSNPVISRVKFVIDDGETMEKVPSTILDCTQSEIVILRQGAISEEEIKKVLKK